MRNENRKKIIVSYWFIVILRILKKLGIHMHDVWFVVEQKILANQRAPS